MDPHEQFVQVPGVALATPVVPQPPRIGESEPRTPLPNGLIGHGDAAFVEQIHNIPKTQVERVVEPDGVANDVRGKAISAEAEWLARHRATLPPAGQRDDVVVRACEERRAGHRDHGVAR